MYKIPDLNGSLVSKVAHTVPYPLYDQAELSSAGVAGGGRASYAGVGTHSTLQRWADGGGEGRLGGGSAVSARCLP